MTRPPVPAPPATVRVSLTVDQLAASIEAIEQAVSLHRSAGLRVPAGMLEAHAALQRQQRRSRWLAARAEQYARRTE